MKKAKLSFIIFLCIIMFVPSIVTTAFTAVTSANTSRSSCSLEIFGANSTSYAKMTAISNMELKIAMEL